MVVTEGVFSIHNTFIQLREYETSEVNEPRLRRRCNSLPDLQKLSREITAQSEVSTVASAADSDASAADSDVEKLDDTALDSGVVSGQQVNQPSSMTAWNICEPCGYYDPLPATCAVQVPVQLLQPPFAGSWTPRPLAIPTVYQQCAKIANQVRARLLAKGHAHSAQVTYEPDGNLYVCADVQDVAAEGVDRVLASAKNAIVALAANESSLRLIGRSSEPFAATEDGFGIVATLGTAPEGEECCWDFYELGFCPRKWNACRWPHASECVSLTVAVNAPSSSSRWEW
jgi:hypothetical protein